jgi:hypothetical protein
MELKMSMIRIWRCIDHLFYIYIYSPVPTLAIEHHHRRDGQITISTIRQFISLTSRNRRQKIRQFPRGISCFPQGDPLKEGNPTTKDSCACT